MNICFYIGRMIYLSYMGPVIECFRNNGDNVTLLCDCRQASSAFDYKAYQYPHLEKVQKIFGKDNVRSFHTTEEFVDIIIKDQLQAVFFFATDPIVKKAKALVVEKKAEVLFMRLQIGLEIMSCKDLQSTDVVFIFCENWKTWWKKWLMLFKIIPEKDKDCIFEQIETKTIASGFPQFDSIADFDRQSICKKYGLPGDKKIIVYLPFPWRVSFSIWSHIIYKPQNKIIKLARLLLHRSWQHRQEVFNCADDLQVANAIRQFADQNNGFFLVKGRLKNKVPSYLEKLADKVVFDESYYPHTTIELMSVADLCLFPFVRQFANVDRLWFDQQTSLSALRKWLNVWLEDALFTRAMQKV